MVLIFVKFKTVGRRFKIGTSQIMEVLFYLKANVNYVTICVDLLQIKTIVFNTIKKEL
jgi:hypothetical protein